MTHLGTRISALADGRLTGAARERALCHVAGCPACADELAATRAARRLLATAGDVLPAPDLASRLLALGAQEVMALQARGPGSGPAPGAGPALGSGPALGGGPVLDDAPTGPTAWAAVASVLAPGGNGRDGVLTDSVLPAPFAARWPSVRSVAALAAGAVVVGLFVLGETRDVTPESHPASDLALLASAGGGAGLGASSAGPAPEPVAAATGAAGAATTDAAWPGAGLPDGYAVVAVQSSATGVRLDLDGPTGPVVVLREPGRLDPDVTARAATVTIGGREVVVLSDAPWHAVWQSGDAVVGVVAAHRSTAVDGLVAAYPEVPADDGIAERMSRGWETVVGAWSP